MSSATIARSFRCVRELFLPVAEDHAYAELDAKLLWSEVSNAGMEHRSWFEAAPDYELLVTPGRACLMCAEAGQASEAESSDTSVFQLCPACAYRLGMEMQQSPAHHHGKLYAEYTVRYHRDHDYTAQARIETWLHRATATD